MGFLLVISQNKIFCDNLAVVQVVKSSKTKDQFLAACIRNIWLISASNDIEIVIEYIEGKKNVIAVKVTLCSRCE